MSAQQEKESCKRARGDDGVLDGIIRPALQGSPEKKKRKSSVQAPVTPLISEYAPPANTSSDHLIASNPFDDDYNISSSSGYRFGNPGYAGLEDYGNFGIPQNASPRTSTRFCAPYAFRDHLRHFPQDGMAMAFGRPSSFSMGIPENSNFENQLFFREGVGQTITMPGQHIRCNRNENLNPMATYNSFQSNSGRSLGQNLNIIPQLETSHTFPQSQSHLMHLKTIVLGRNSNVTSAPQDSESVIPSKSHKSHVICTENLHSDCADVVNGGQTTGSHSRLHVAKSSKADVTTNEKCNKWLLHSSRCGHVPSELLYSCGICSEEVRNLHDAIMCEVSCQKWFHRSCTGMTEMAYALLSAETSAIWGCDSCMAKKDVQLVHTSKSIE